MTYVWGNHTLSAIKYKKKNINEFVGFKSSFQSSKKAVDEYAKVHKYLSSKTEMFLFTILFYFIVQ